MVKKIQFCGSQGSGKTTMRKILVDKLSGAGYKVIGNYKGVKKSISRDAYDEGFPLNTGTTFEAQYYMASKYISLDILTNKFAENNGYSFIVTDRTVLDVIPYTQASNNINKKDKEIIENMLINHVNRFPPDLVIYTKPIDRLEDDGLRSINSEFSAKIDELFYKILLDSRLYNKNCRLCTLENNTIENRMKEIYKQVSDVIGDILAGRSR